MRFEPVAIAALTVMASTMGAMACRAWDQQENHRQAMQCVRPGMTAWQVRTVLGRPRAVWTGAGRLKAVLKAEGGLLQRRPPTGWRRALVYPTTRNSRLVVLLDGRGRTTAVLDYGS
jgi:hypothetical protein